MAISDLLQQYVSQPSGGQNLSAAVLNEVNRRRNLALAEQQRKQQLADQISLLNARQQNDLSLAKQKATMEQQAIADRIKMAIEQGIPVLGQSLGQRTRPSIQPQEPPPEAAMSLASGGFGTVDGKPIRQQPQEQSLKPQFDSLSKQQSPFVIDLLSGKTISNPDYVSPLEQQRFDLAKERFDLEKEKAAKDVNVTGLSGSDEIQARALSRRIGGVRGARDIFPTVIKLMQEGKTVDDIEDEIRFGGQSKALAGPIRDAAQSILINAPVAKSQQTLDFIDDELSKGNISKVTDILKKSARDTSGVESRRAIMGKERTVEFLDEIQSNLDALERNGVNTNIFSGTLENINAKVGRVSNPELRKIATKIATAIQNYRRSMSGVAFSVPESEEYKTMFPSISRVSNFNRANIDALKEVMQGDLDNFYSLSMGDENYRTLFGESSNESRQIQQEQSESVPSVGSMFQGQKVINVRRIK